MDTSFVVSSASGLGYGTLRSFEASDGWAAFGPTEIGILAVQHAKTAWNDG